MAPSRKQTENIENFVRENASMIARTEEENSNKRKRRMYKCKACDKEYDSFQALGGHRASHRKDSSRSGLEPGFKPKLHVCEICGQGFEIGQSLGGHKRKHYQKASNPRPRADSVSSSSSIASNSNSKEAVLEYDLNLTPLENEAINTSILLQIVR